MLSQKRDLGFRPIGKSCRFRDSFFYVYGALVSVCSYIRGSNELLKMYYLIDGSWKKI